MKYKPTACLLGVIFYFLPTVKNVSASDKFITVVNPVRISSYTQNINDSINAQYKEIAKQKLSATWLFTYDVLLQKPEALKNFNSDQETGIFFEVTPKLAASSNVEYRNTGSWHHANSVFLVAYTQSDRIKIIDTVMAQYYSIYGRYPKSVGAWWIDSYSLAYMQKKYQVTSNLSCADQFSTDGYQIWGSYWSSPYYPSSINSGLPADSLARKIDVVTIQWAPRDPYYGYYDSTYSTQDYFTRPGKNIDYFEKLISIYTESKNNSFGQITVGLEGDFSPETYSTEYAKQLAVVKKYQQNQGVRVVKMSEFTEWYRTNFRNLTPPMLIMSNDKDINSYWYQNSSYRIGWIQTDSGQKIRDLRVYIPSMEAFYISPNRQNILFSNVLSLLDEVSDSNRVWNLDKNATVNPTEQSLVITNNTQPIPEFIKRSHYVKIKNIDSNSVEIYLSSQPLTDRDTMAFSADSRHTFKSPGELIKKIIAMDLSFLTKKHYIVPNTEVEALSVLQTYPAGKVLVANSECLQCEYHSQLPPVFITNDRQYVQLISGKEIVYDPGILTASSREAAKKLLRQTAVEYIYLVKYESYQEKLSYSPGDYGVSQLFENASAQIWKVEK